MKKQNFFSKITSFAAGMAVMAVLITLVVPASAAGSQFACNRVGFRSFNQQRVKAGENYTAPNGRQVPVSITYTDKAGGEAHYINVDYMAELLDATVDWNEKNNSVDIACARPSGGLDVQITPRDWSVPLAPNKPEYGKTAGCLEEIDPATVNLSPEYRIEAYAENLHMQWEDTQSIPGFLQRVYPGGGQEYLVYTVKNNGTKVVYSQVRREITITYGENEGFQDVAVLPGETLVRVFRVLEDPHPLERKFRFSVMDDMDRDHPNQDVNISLEMYSDTPQES